MDFPIHWLMIFAGAGVLVLFGIAAGIAERAQQRRDKEQPRPDHS